MWVVLRSAAFLALALISFVVLVGIGAATGQLFFIENVYPVSNDVEMAFGYGLIAAAGLVCLIIELRYELRHPRMGGLLFWRSS